ncbi:MAG: type II secretion system F family protein [Candidatus Gracilibacteria bacterium]|nr:type II secretion system F family protein [Candidatus Gracilibacteria bacterium]
MENTNKIENKPSETFFIKKVGLIDKYNFYEYISVMLDGGVGVTESLESVNSKIASPYFKSKIRELITYISSGDSFSKSMKKIPSVFESPEISIIESGETTGSLSKSLLKLSEDLKKVYELKNKIKGALTYPMIIFLFLFLALGIVLTYVIPSIKPLFDDAGVELPIATKALLATSDFMINNIWLIFLFIATVIVLLIGYKNTKSGKIAIEGFLFSLPLVGKIYKNYILANIASNLATLIGSGINIVKALTLVSKGTNSYIYMDLFDEVIIRVSRGEGIVKSMEEVDQLKQYFPSDYLQMLSVGERTANIESICLKMNKQYDKEVDYSLARLTKWIEPIAILFAGVFVLWFAFAIFGAILKVTQTVG